MHLTLIFIVIISYSTAYSHPMLLDENQQKPQQHRLEKKPSQNDELNSSASRPLQQFFKKILSAFRVGSRTTTFPATTTQRTSVPSNSHQQQIEIQEIPNFVDFSTYLLDSFTSNNSAIKFSYIQPNTSSLRGGNYSVITFLIPEKTSKQGFFGQFIELFRFPWDRQPKPPADTVYQNFPPLFEYWAQRLQAYYSIYKYTDGSRLNNTIVFEVPDDTPNDELNPNQQEALNDDIIETTTDYLINDNELLTTTELNL